MDFLGIFFLCGLVGSIFISNFFLYKKLKTKKLKLNRLKVFYFFISILLIFIAIFLVAIFANFIEENIFPNLRNPDTDIAYRSTILFIILALYFIFQYFVNVLFDKKILLKKSKENYEEIGINVND